MILFNDKQRSEELEIMDNFDFHGYEMKDLFGDLKTVNKLLGGNAITIDGIEELLKNHSIKGKITIMDIGCGDGELLRKCAAYGKKNNLDFELIGIDFNENILDFARKNNSNFPNIKFEKVDVFLNEELIPKCDIALCTLVLHHFSNDKIEYLIKLLTQKSSIGLVINDLQRNKQAFNLFKIFSKLFLKTKTAKHDGLISISKGFKKEELEIISKKIPNQKSSIHWHWAYRYQWILKKIA